MEKADLEKFSLAGLLPLELDVLLKKILSRPVPDFRSRQICRWINKGAIAFFEMNNLPLSLREELQKKCTVFSSQVSDKTDDKYSTVKLQITLKDNNKIEAVIIKDNKGRKTACISTQAGCSLSCTFCHTGSLGFKRNLLAQEMAEQFLHLKKEEPDITHIVIMGMGEPLLNLEELRKAVDFFTHKEGMGISKKRITISTAGIADRIKELADNGPNVRLAMSLVSARQAIREKLMPIAKTYPLPLLRQNLEYYQGKLKSRITLEMVLLKDINTCEEEANAVQAFAASLDVLVNLIPWNPISSAGTGKQILKTPSKNEIMQFAKLLEKRKIKVSLRMSKGCSISGACGQLGS